MKRKLLALGAVWIAALALTGCWDIKSIQDTNYITALGCDYKDGRYIVYAQMVDFSNVSKQEGGKSNGSPGVWVGREEGATVVEAMTRLLETSQQHVFFGHVTALLFSENAIKQGIREYLDGLIRYRELRYTQWMYVSKVPINKLMTVTPFFNLTPLASILHQPEDHFRQRSVVRPLKLNAVATQLSEPGAPLLLPALNISESVWEKNDEADPKLKMDGVYAVPKTGQPQWIPEEQLRGLRWIDSKSRKSAVTVERDGKAAAAVFVESPTVSVVPEETPEGKASFTVTVRCKAFLSELQTNMDEKEVEREAVKVVTSEIEKTYSYGKKNGLDLFRFEHTLYRTRFPAWSRLTNNGEVPLNHALKSVRVEMELTHSGMYKMRDQKQQY